MQKSNLLNTLTQREVSITLEHILDNAKADSGGERDVKFLQYLIHGGLIIHEAFLLHRLNMESSEEYYLERYKKMNYESDRHFLCRTIIQDELKRRGFETFSGMDIGNMEVLRSNSNYDIITDDFQCLIDVGLSPARNFFRGLTDMRAKTFLITTFFDDYEDDILFSTFSRSDDQAFTDAVRDYEESFKPYVIPFEESLGNENRI